MLNLAPVNDVTATLVHDVLEVAGADLFQCYGRAVMGRLLDALARQFLPAIRQGRRTRGEMGS